MRGIARALDKQRVYVRSILIIALIGLVVFIAGALYSYNPDDSSCIYFSTDVPMQVTNWCGAAGAHIAALLWYFFGASAWLLCLLLLFIIYMLIMRVTLVAEWDRLLAWAILVPVSAVFCNRYTFDSSYSLVPGGLVGMYAMRLLHDVCTPVGAIMCVYLLLYVCLIVLLRFSFMRLLMMVLPVVEQSILALLKSGDRLCGVYSFLCRGFLACKVKLRGVKFYINIFLENVLG